MDRKIDARVNAFTCPVCKEMKRDDTGTLFVPADLDLIAKLEAKKVYKHRQVECTRGHVVDMRLHA